MWLLLTLNYTVNSKQYGVYFDRAYSKRERKSEQIIFANVAIQEQEAQI